MSSFFSCTGKKNPFRRSKKNKKKEPEDVYKKKLPLPEEEVQIDERKPPQEDHIPEVKINGGDIICGQCQENSDLHQEQNDDIQTEEPASPFLKELQEKLQERDKDKDMVVEEKFKPVKGSAVESVSEVKTQNKVERQLSESKGRPKEEADLEVELLKAMLKKIENENEKLQKNLKNLEDQYFRTKMECDNKIDKIKSENRILRKENDGLLEENERLKIRGSDSKLNKVENQALVSSDIIHNEETLSEMTFRVQSVAEEREEILSAIESLVNVCSSLEPRLEKIEQTTTSSKPESTSNEDISLTSRLENINGEHENLSVSLKGLMKRLQELECRIIELEVNETDNAELSEIESSMALRIEQTDAYLAQLQVELQQTRESCLLLEQTLKMSENERERLSTETGKLRMENEEHKQHIEDLQSILEMREIQLDKQRETKNMVKENIQLSGKCEDLSSQVQEKHRACEMMSSQLVDLRSKYDELYVKFSELSSSNSINVDNASIEELDDLHSPTAISERFRTELYDNDWRQAYEKLTTVCRRDEKKTLQILLDFCTEGYLHCRRVSRQQLDMICSVLCAPSSSHIRGGLSRRSSTGKMTIDSIPPTLRQQIISFRRKPTKDFIQQLYEDFMNQLDFDKSRHLRNVHEREVQEISPYISKCLEICWSMVVQDPPMYLQFKLRHGSEIETDKYDCFSHFGGKADYLVWPALLREENGTVLQKGAIQAIPDRP